MTSIRKNHRKASPPSPATEVPLAAFATTPWSDHLPDGSAVGRRAPYVLALRGFGANLGGDPSRPIENAPEACRVAHGTGVRSVELNLQHAAEGQGGSRDRVQNHAGVMP